jgi:hypothetical protein
MVHQSGCLICGEALTYFERLQKVNCVICSGEFEGDANCVQGHYVCNTCHSGNANDWVEGYCLHSTETDPVAMANTLMHSPKVKMHGPEHHFLVPAVLLTAYYNVIGEPDQKAKKIRQARKRGENVLGGFCGFYGACGAGVGTGIFISLLTDSTPLSESGWRLSNLMTARSLEEIACHGGPRCCKRDTFLALQTAQLFLEQNFNISLPITEPILCGFSEMNKECLEGGCPYFSGIG